ncbi:MAG: phosphomannomutase/phosphoglucomutase [Acidobacteriota bacterium]|nr:phosphomannomutase/phosphoglucomutase [Acidobacteriota bacterium]
MNPEIFREYDIRGIAESDLTNPVVFKLGQSLGTYLGTRGCKKMTLGRDCRMSSVRLMEQLSRGLLSTGLSIVDIGVCPTPVLYFSLHHLNLDAGIMITGSHNPPEYNGFKVAVGSLTIHGEQIQEVRKIAEAGTFLTGEGNKKELSLASQYRDCLAKAFGRLSNPLKVVVDAGNGTGAVLGPQVYRDMGCEVIELYCTMDGNFPNHHPDPTVVEYLQDLLQMVQDEKADLGIAFDGDTDRIGVVDDIGNIVWGDDLMILYSREILANNPGATIVGEVKCSKNLYDEIAKLGGRGIMWKAGHSLIKSKMKDEEALLGGEMSGHMFFADRYFGYDDAIYAGARLLENLSESGRKISELLSDVPKTYSTPEIRVNCPEALKFKVVGQAREYFSQHYTVVLIDGVRVLFDRGWGLVRASNTQPIIVLRFEAESPELLEEIQSLVEGKIQEFQETMIFEISH